MSLITTTDQLVIICERLKAAEFVTVDTEFLRENTYFPKLCLIQIADDEAAHAIDPLAPGIDLSPFYELMQDEKILKVLHASRQDIEIFVHQTGKVPRPVFDTQLAASVCGFGDSVGYETLVNKLARASVDKSSRYTDWSRRPLTDKQLNYALGDVTHLRTIYRKLNEQLEESGRSEWLREEMDVLEDPGTYVIEPGEAWKRVKVRTNKAEFLAILRATAQWREEQAKERDMPRNRIAKDEVLLEICAHPPKDEDSLERIRGLSKGFARSRGGKSLLAAVDEALNSDPETWPPVTKSKPRVTPPPMVDLLKVLLKIRCNEQNVAPRLIASAQEVEKLAVDRDADIRAMHGWRFDVFGQDAVDLMDGKLALTASDGSITVVKSAD